MTVKHPNALSRMMLAGAMLALANMPAMAQAAPCPHSFEASHDGTMHMVTLPDGWLPNARVMIEGRAKDEKLWSIEGRYICSVGLPFCYASLLNTDGSTADFPVETVEEDGVARFLVIAHLHQTFATRSYQQQEPKFVVEFVSGRGDDSAMVRPLICLSGGSMPMMEAT